ncbi:MAG: hypothetical protein HY399_02195, partial [Elusimicrobia bacterium]|nr:hypothetical protein [Elusimicrobiota bacterium]
LSAKGEWKEAAKAYAIILEKYPRVSLTPAARLRYALAILKLAKTSKPSVASAYEEEAIRYLKSVLADYPSSPQAKLAKDRLKAMESAPLPTSKSTK